jgi:hypothetical protein
LRCVRSRGKVSFAAAGGLGARGPDPAVVCDGEENQPILDVHKEREVPIPRRSMTASVTRLVANSS